jgi:hypothetical protein
VLASHLGVAEKQTSFSDLFGASRKAPKKLLNGQKPPNGHTNIRKIGFSITDKTAFW